MKATVILLLLLGIALPLAFSPMATAAPSGFGSSRGGAQVSANSNERDGLRQSASFVSTLGSLSLLSVGIAPQTMACATCCAIRAADIPGQITAACKSLCHASANLSTLIVHTFKETVHWLALPIRIFRAGLQSAPLPSIANPSQPFSPQQNSYLARNGNAR